jgi:hypothetical protein
MVAESADRVVTMPALETLATLGIRELHVTERPVRTLPLAPFASAAACVICPGSKPVAPSVTATVAEVVDDVTISPSPILVPTVA